MKFKLIYNTLMLVFIMFITNSCDNFYLSSYYYNNKAILYNKGCWEIKTNKTDVIYIGKSIDIRLRGDTVYMNNIKFKNIVFSGNKSHIFNKYDFFGVKLYSNGIYNHRLYISSDPTVYMSKNCALIDLTYRIKKYNSTIHSIDRQYMMCEGDK